MYYELIQRDPSLMIPYVLFSLGLTVLAYGGFPFAFARMRKKRISKKKYRFVCYGFNFVICLIFAVINGGTFSGGPYLLWTWIFTRNGIKKLEERYLLIDSLSEEVETNVVNTDHEKPDDSNGLIISEEKDANRVMAELLAATIVEGQKAVNANRDATAHNLDDPEYGIVPEKPIYVKGVDGEERYLQALRTYEGIPITWNRRGSMMADGIHGMIDIYDTYLPNGESHKTLYLNMYSSTDSVQPPVGFYRYAKPENNMKQAESKVKQKNNVTIETNKRKKGGNKTLGILTGIIACLIVVALCIAIYQIIELRDMCEIRNKQIAELRNEVSELEQTISIQSETINVQGETITKQNEYIDSLEDKATNYDQICTALRYGNIGSAANNFKADKSIIVLRDSERNCKFTLTAHWNRGGTVEVSYSSSAARVTFDKDSWGTSTTMTVIPKCKGATVVTFKNSVNNDQFKILIIVV